MPLPIPWSESSSPSHITAREPAVRVVTIMKASPRVPENIPWLPIHAVMPTACTTAKTIEPYRVHWMSFLRPSALSFCIFSRAGKITTRSCITMLELM